MATSRDTYGPPLSNPKENTLIQQPNSRILANKDKDRSWTADPIEPLDLLLNLLVSLYIEQIKNQNRIKHVI